MTELWLKLGYVCFHCAYFKNRIYPCDGTLVLHDLVCSPLQPHPSWAPFCSLCFSSLSHLHVLDLGMLFHTSVFVCFSTQIPSFIMPSFLCLSWGMSHLSRFISSVNSSLNLSSTSPLLGEIDPLAPCVSRSLIMLSLWQPQSFSILTWVSMSPRLKLLWIPHMLGLFC